MKERKEGKNRKKNRKKETIRKASAHQTNDPSNTVLSCVVVDNGCLEKV